MTACLVNTFTSPPYQYSWDTTWYSGSNTIEMIAYDQAGNTATQTETVILDHITRSLTAANGVTSQITFVVSGSTTVYWQCNYNATIYNSAPYFNILDNNSNTIVAQLSSGSGSFTAQTGTTYTINAYGGSYNLAPSGMIYGTMTGSVSFSDITPPAVNILINNNTAVNNTVLNGPLTVTASALDDNGIANVTKLTLLNSSGQGILDLLANSSFGSDQYPDGNYAIQAIAYDDAMNQATATVNVTFANTPVLTVANTNLKPDGTVWTHNPVTLNCTNIAINNRTYKIFDCVSGTAVDATQSLTNQASLSTDSVTFANSLSQGKHVLYIQTADQFNNTSNQYILNIDDNAPVINSVSIDQGNPYTNNPILTIAFSAADAGSGLYQIRFSETTDFSKSSWQVITDSTTSVIYSLTTGDGDGLKTIYTQVMDYAGNVTQYSGSSQITLDTHGPVSTLTVSQIGGEISIDATAQDATSGVQRVELDINGSYNQDLSLSSGTQYSVLLAVNTLTNTAAHLPFTITAWDNANNSTTISSKPLNVTNQSPLVGFLPPTPDGFQKQTVNLQISVTDCVTSVVAYAGTQCIATFNNLSQWSNGCTTWSLDTTLLPRGSCMITLYAYDANGNMGQGSITLDIRNPLLIQQVRPLAPINGN